MHKVDSFGATDQNEFSNGDVGMGVPRTRLEAKWMNSLQREVVGVIEQAGITLSDTDDAQLRAAVMLHVLNISALRNLPVPSAVGSRKVHVFVEGFTTSDDGGDGVFRWESASSAADDADLIVKPNADPRTGRWVRVQTTTRYPRTAAEIAAGAVVLGYNYPPGNIRRYGGDPTGVASSDVAGQAMLDQRAQGGAACYVPTGTYKQTVVWTYPLSTTNLVLYGDGIQATSVATALNIEQLTNAGADASNGLFFPLIYDIEFANTFPVVAGAGSTKFHIHLKNALRALFRNVRCRSIFDDTDHNDANHGGIWFELVSGFQAAFLNIVEHCWMDHCQILMENSDSVVSDSIIYGHNCQYGIKASGGNLTVTHCQIMGSRSKGGVWISPGALNCKIANNFFDGSYDQVNSGYGVVVEPAPGASNFLQITGNTFWRQSFNGVRAIDAVAMTINGNTFWDCGRADSRSEVLNADIVIESRVFSSASNAITGNTAYRGATRANAGLFILEVANPRSATNNRYVANTVTAPAAQYRAPAIVTNVGLFSNGSQSIASIGFSTEAEAYSGFTGTGTGFAVSPTGFIKYSLADNKVTLLFSAITGVSNAPSFTITGMPAVIRPLAAVYGAVLIKNNGVDELGFISVGTSGVISVFRTVGGLSPSSFTSSGTKEIGAGSTITYPLQ